MAKKKVTAKVKEVIDKVVEKKEKSQERVVTSDSKLVSKVQNKINVLSISSDNGKKIYTLDCTQEELDKLI